MRVEALLLLADARRGGGAGLNHQHAARARDEVAGILARGVMRMAGEQHVDPGFLYRLERKLMAADGALDLVPDLEREQRMVGDQYPEHVLRHMREVSRMK